MDIAHFNAVIINKNTKRIEYFEPYAQVKIKNIEKFENTMYYYFTKIINKSNKEYKFKFIGHSCPIGLQTLQESEEKMPKGTGLCTAWCILIMHIIILNPTSKTSDIIKHLISKHKTKLSDYIRKYIAYLGELR